MKVVEAVEAYTKNSTNLTELLTLVRNFDFPSLKTIVESLLAIVTAQNDHLAKWAESSASMAWSTDTANIKAIMTEMFCAFKWQPFSTPSSSAHKPTLALTRIPANLGGNSTHHATISPVEPSQPEGEKAEMETEEKEHEVATVEKEPEHTPQDTKRPQPTEIVINITPPEQSIHELQPESQHTTPNPDRGKGIARDTDKSPQSLLKPQLKFAHMEKEEKMKKAGREARQMLISKPELIKVVNEVTSKAGVDPKDIHSSKGGQEFIKKQDAEIKVHNREHLEKLKKARELKKKRINQYRWTTTNRRKPETITVHNPFRFGDFGITEWDELNAIIPKKKNKVVVELMTSLSKKYDRPKAIPGEIGINPTLPALEQVQSPSSSRKRKAKELEPEVRIPRLECNRSLPKGV
ncbi:hypothetical protein Tco_0578663 [Tanacetum coccineum]